MIYTKEGDPGKGGHGGYVFRAEKAFATKPEVEPCPRIVNGQLLYHGTGKDKGRTYIADAFERTWNTTPGQIRPASYRGRVEKILH